jgi:hypothetical protein
MPRCLTVRRLEAAASRLFDVSISGDEASIVVVIFRLDGTACSARSFDAPALAARAMDSIRVEIRRMSAAEFIERHRLEHLLIDRGGRCSPRTGGRPPDAGSLYLRVAAKRR